MGGARFNGYYVSLSLLEHLERAIAVHQPVIGLSERVRVPRARFRDAVVEFVDEVVDALELATCLPGTPMGAARVIQPTTG